MGVQLTIPVAAHGGLNWDTNNEANWQAISDAYNLANQGVSGADLNTITQSGWYYVSSGANTPAGSANGFLVLDMTLSGNATAAQLAINVNSDGAVYIRRRSASAWQPWVQLSSGDTGWVTTGTGMTAATGWTLNSAKYRIRGGVVTIGANITRTGAAITANALGVITVTNAVTLPAGLTPAQTNGTINSVGSASTALVFGTVGNGGSLALSAAAPSQSIATGAVLDLLGTYLL